MNYFNPRTAAERYSKGRPDFHPNTIKHIKDHLHLDKKLDETTQTINYGNWIKFIQRID